MAIDPNARKRPVYVVESNLETIKHGGKTLAGTRAEGCVGVFLFKLPLDATEVEIRRWPASIHAEPSGGLRVSPSGKEAWWISTRGSPAKWPRTGERSNGKPLKD